MGFKFYLPIVNILLSKVSKDLLEGKPVQISCHLLFNDGYSPLLLKSSQLYLTYANAIISTLKPDAYIAIENNLSFTKPGNADDGINCLSAVLVTRTRKIYVIGRRYTINSGKVSFLDKEPSKLPPPFYVSLRLKELYNELPEADQSHPNFKKLVSAVSYFVTMTKMPYSKVIKNSLH
jgi:hypothetical protein